MFHILEAPSGVTAEKVRGRERVFFRRFSENDDEKKIVVIIGRSVCMKAFPKSPRARSEKCEGEKIERVGGKFTFLILLLIDGCH